MDEFDVRNLPGAFSTLMHFPSTWLDSVHQLIRCADILRPCCRVEETAAAKFPDLVSHVRGPELLLRGTVLENLFKSMIVAREELWREENRKSLDRFEGDRNFQHRLVAIASVAAFDLIGDEARICEVLTHFVRWRARYPGPKRNAEWDRGANWEQRWDPILDALTKRAIEAALAESNRVNEIMIREQAEREAKKVK